MCDLCVVQQEYGVRQRGGITGVFYDGTGIHTSGESCRAVLAFSPLRYGSSGLLRTSGGSPGSHERAWHPRCRILCDAQSVATLLWPRGERQRSEAMLWVT
jgi:hypothetical protein